MEGAEPVRKRRRKERQGGIRQRIAGMEEEDPSHTVLESALALLLIHMVTLGHLSCPNANKIALAAQKDLNKVMPPDTSFPLLNSLCSGHARNVWRDIYRAIKDLPRLPSLFQVWLPMVVEGVLTTALAGILLPHELFACLYLQYNATWMVSMVPALGHDVLSDFWHQCRGHPALLGHPLRSRNKSRCIPIGMHIDEVPVTGRGKIWCKTAAIFSWFSLIARAGQAGTLNSLFLIVSLYERLFQKGEQGTVDTFMAILYWSFMCLWQGKWPHKDWRGVAQL